MHSRRMFLSRLAATTAIGTADLAEARQTLGESPDGNDRDSPKDFSGKPMFIQPDFAAWARIKDKMTEADVLRILGEPLEREKPKEKEPGDDADRIIRPYGWVYGRIDFKSPMVPIPNEFRISFAEGRVWQKYDPFGARLSRDGKPTVPRLIYPLTQSTYEHYPRYLDLRWLPSSGRYPIHYVVEQQSGLDLPHERNGATTYEREWNPVKTWRVDIPYLLIVHGGSQPGRWRVKAVNATGESAWSEYREFAFRI